MVSRLTREIAFYRKYHRHPVNVGLHIVFIPTILATSIYGLSAVRYNGSEYLTLGMLLSLYYLYFYARLDGLFGTIVGSCVVAEALYFGKQTAVNPRYGLSWAIWATGWIAQFIGHGAFEGKAPALFDNLQQALLLAPFFAVLEILSFVGVKHAKEELQKVDLTDK